MMIFKVPIYNIGGFRRIRAQVTPMTVSLPMMSLMLSKRLLAMSLVLA